MFEQQFKACTCQDINKFICLPCGKTKIKDFTKCGLCPKGSKNTFKTERDLVKHVAQKHGLSAFNAAQAVIKVEIDRKRREHIQKARDFIEESRRNAEENPDKVNWNQSGILYYAADKPDEDKVILDGLQQEFRKIHLAAQNKITENKRILGHQLMVDAVEIPRLGGGLRKVGPKKDPQPQDLWPASRRSAKEFLADLIPFLKETHPHGLMVQFLDGNYLHGNGHLAQPILITHENARFLIGDNTEYDDGYNTHSTGHILRSGSYGRWVGESYNRGTKIEAYPYKNAWVFKTPM